MKSRIVGRWRIVEMDHWDQDAVDLVGPAFIRFRADGTGDFGFIAVRGFLDCRYARDEDRATAEFSWDGDDEGDPASGRGWAQIEPDGSLTGHIFFHLGDDSGFRGVREGESEETPGPDPPRDIRGM